MTSYTSQGIPVSDADALDPLIYASPVKASIMARPTTPSIKREFCHGSLSSSPASPCHSMSSSMATSASSGSLSSVASRGSGIAALDSGLPNTFPYNVIRPVSPGPVSPFSSTKRPSTPASVPPPTPHTINELTKSLNKRPRSDSSGTSSSSPVKKFTSPAKRSPPKDGLEVWPEEVEAAFMEALRIIPKLGRRKVHINGKACGRNELIALYIMSKTQQIRSRKQVSSHIQVLKNLRKNDAEFMELVYDGEVDGEGLPEALLQAGFTLSQIPSFKNNSSSLFPPLLGLAASPMDNGEALLSPYTPTFLSRESSLVPSPLVSPFEGPTTGGLDPLFTFDNGPGYIQASPGSALAGAMKDMQFPFPAQTTLAGRQTASLLPRSFCIWADSEHSEDTHIYTELAADSAQGSTPASIIYFEDLYLAQIRFAKLAEMYNSLPCQFMHATVQMAVPSMESGLLLDAVHSSISLSSMQDLKLTSVITIFANGTEVMSMEEPLNGPFRNAPPVRIEQDEHQVDGSPCTPFRQSKAPRHRFAYNSPFATDFWSVFLRGILEEGQSPEADGLPSIAKSLAERHRLSGAIAGVSAIQEFVVKAEGNSPIESSNSVSPGSSLGNVVLVIAYDFRAAVEGTAPLTTLSYLSMRNFAAGSPTNLSPGHKPSPGQSALVMNLEVPAGGSSSTRHRPNLTVNIPAPQPGRILINGQATPQHLTTPITPAMQIMHTPPFEYFYKA